MKCRIVSSSNYDDVAASINGLLDQGWEMKDRLIVTCYPGYHRFTQMMVKEEKD